MYEIIQKSGGSV